MSSATVRMSASSNAILREIAAETGETIQAILDKAIEEYRRRRLGSDANVPDKATRHVDAWAAQQEAEPLWMMFEELQRDVPDEVWRRLPADASDHIDRYVYGRPEGEHG